MTNKNTYKTIVKTTGIYGGIEGIKIFLGVIQSKVLAVLLGPAGIGLDGLFRTAINTLTMITGLGLRTSAVREIAEANSINKVETTSKTVITLRRWMWFTGLIGMLITLCLSPMISQWTFGNRDYTWAFLLLSLIILLTSLHNGQIALMQGMRKIPYYAKANLFGVIVGVSASIPCYLLWDIKGIVPALIIAALCRLIFSLYYSRKIRIENYKISYRDSFKLGSRMVKLGIFLVLGSSISMLFTYLINAYIARISGIEFVGIYRAGFLITTYYVSLVFSAMGADYLPRLSEANKDNRRMKDIVNQQAEIGILIIAPLIVSLITLAPIIVQLLYSKEFLQVTNYISLAIMAMIFRASSWSMSYILLAKGRGLLFFITEASIALFLLIANIVGYKYFGLVGLGVAYIITYVIYFITHCIIDKKLFNFSFDKEFIIIFIITNIIAIISYIIYKIVGHPWMYLIGGVITLGVSTYSLIEINKRVSIKSILSNVYDKFLNKGKK